MRTIVLAMACMAGASPAWSQAESIGVFQSDLDGRRYEVRTAGQLRLEIYSENGKELLALLSREKASEDFKGTTRRLATKCPNNSGKIETRSLASDQIEMRVEVAQQPLLGKPRQRRCNIRFGAAWQNFTLVAAPAVSATAAPTTSTNAAPVLEASFEQVLFRVVSAEAQGNELVVTLSVLNQGIDRQLRASYFVGCGKAAEMIDDKGKTYGPALVRLGNQNCQSDLLNAVATQMTVTFRNLATIGGVLEASALKRLTLGSLDVARRTRGGVEFRNIPIRRVD